MRTKDPNANKPSNRYWNRNFRRSKYGDKTFKTAAWILHMTPEGWSK